MKKLILLAGFSGILLSCGSSGTDIVDQIITQNMILPVKMNVDGDITNINYNGMKIVSMINASNPGNKIIFNYSGDLIANISEYENNNLVTSEDYSYNGNVLSTLLIKDYVSGTVATQVKYTYTFSGNNINVQKVLTSGAANNYTVNNVYSLSNGNVVNINGTGSGLINGTTTSSISQTGNFTYSAKNYVFKNVVGFDKLIFNGDTEGVSLLFSNAKNNMLTYKSATSYPIGGVTTNSGSYFKYNTTYNDKDFPATEIRQSTDANGNPDTSQPDTFVYTYNYQ